MVSVISSDSLMFEYRKSAENSLHAEKTVSDNTWRPMIDDLLCLAPYPALPTYTQTFTRLFFNLPTFRRIKIIIIIVCKQEGLGTRLATPTWKIKVTHKTADYGPHAI